MDGRRHDYAIISDRRFASTLIAPAFAEMIQIPYTVQTPGATGNRPGGATNSDGAGQQLTLTYTFDTSNSGRGRPPSTDALSRLLINYSGLGGGTSAAYAWSFFPSADSFFCYDPFCFKSAETDLVVNATRQ
jgi:hypothetical protein